MDDKKLKLNPMAIPLIAQHNDTLREKGLIPSPFFRNYFDLVTKNLHNLDEVAIKNINAWTQKMLDGMALDDPDTSYIGKNYEFKFLLITKIQRSGNYYMIAENFDEKSPFFKWKVFIKGTNSDFNLKDKIKLEGIISDFGVGIIFLRRVIKINKLID